jgi:protein ImuA
LPFHQLKFGDLAFVCPLDHGSVTAALTAAKSCFSPLANKAMALTPLSAMRTRLDSGSHLRFVLVMFSFEPLGPLAGPAVHDIRAPPGTAAHVSFVALLLAGFAPAMPLLWISPCPQAYPPGLASLGLDPARCLFAQARDDVESLATLEVALRGGMAGVAECQMATRLAARRLALAAKTGGGIGFLLRHAPAFTRQDSTAFATRWLISPAPAGPAGAPRLRAELLYAKGTQPAVFLYDIVEEETKNGATPLALALVGRSPEPAEHRRAG